MSNLAAIHAVKSFNVVRFFSAISSVRKNIIISCLFTDPPQSPVSSVSERFQSPPAGSSSAKKRLFSEGPGVHNVRTSVLKAGQSLLQTSAKMMSINIQSEFSLLQSNVPYSFIFVGLSLFLLYWFKNDLFMHSMYVLHTSEVFCCGRIT
jgi:hypothetical protein